MSARPVAQGSVVDTLVVSSGNSIPRRLNRPVSHEAEQELRQLLERDERLLEDQQKYKALIAWKLTESRLACAAAHARLHDAILAQKVAKNLCEVLARSISSLNENDSRAWMTQEYTALDLSGDTLSKAIGFSVQILKTTADQLAAVADKATEALTQVQEKATIAKEAHESALVIEEHLNEEHRRITNLVGSLKETIRTKRVPLQACLRVPLSIWEITFDYVVSADGELEVAPEEQVKGWKHGSRTSMLSTVCHSWRSMIHSSPSLWRYIYISMSCIEEARTRVPTHFQNCKAVAPILAISFDSVTTAQSNQLGEIFRCCVKIPLARLSCIGATTYGFTGSCLQMLPAPKVLEIKRKYFRRDIPLVIIPRHFFDNLTIIKIKNVYTRTEDTIPSSQCLEKFIFWSPDHHIFPQWLSRFTSALTTIRFNCHWSNQGAISPCAFTNLQNLHMPLVSLSSCLQAGYTFPSLRKLVIINTSESTVASWENLNTLPMRHLRLVIIEMIDREHVGSLVNLINTAKCAPIVELASGSVNLMLGERPLFSSVRILKIAKYKGNIDIIAGYVQWAVSPENSLESSDEGVSKEGVVPTKRALQEIRFADCPNIGHEDKLMIEGLLST